MFGNEEHLSQGSDPVRRRGASSAAARIFARFDHERENCRPFVLSSLRTFFPAVPPQTSRCHPLAHSLTHRKNITPAFPFTSALLFRSFAQERKLTPLFSCACARFCRKWGYRENLVRKLDCQYSLLSRSLRISPRCYATNPRKPFAAAPRSSPTSTRQCIP